MEDFLTYIGSLASIGSIPLAIYLYLKSREQKKDKIRREILKIISYQIGENRTLDLFEVEKIINSNLRNSKLSKDSINIRSILEDLISDTISSPLLDSKSKDEILKNIKGIFPDQNAAQEVKYSTTKYSTLFAITTAMISILGLSLTLIVGESGWSENMDKVFSLNLVKGFWPNLAFSVIAAVLGMITSLIAFKKLNKTKANKE